jgi:uncharacterized membrane protein YbhN (UPF0104 family)
MTTRRVWLGVQLLGTIVLLTVLFRRIDWPQMGGVLGQMSPALILGSLAVVAFGQLLFAWRWQVVLAGMGVQVGFPEVLRQYLIGLFFSNVVPTAVGGDAAKVYYLGRRAGYARIGASVVVDRFLGFLWLSFIGAALAWTVGGDSPVHVLNRQLLALFAAGFIAILLVAALVPVERVLNRLPGRLGALAVRISPFVLHLREGAFRPAALAASGAAAVIYSLLVAFVYSRYFLANELPGVSLPQFMNVVISVAIFVNVPVSVNGIGLREQLNVLLLAALGASTEIAVGISLLLFAHALVLSLIGCALWLSAKPAIEAAAAP